MRPEDVMDIHAPKGTQVVYAFTDNGYDSDQELAQHYLVEGGVYTVDHTDVHRSSTDVYLKGFESIDFNSVLFKNLEESK